MANKGNKMTLFKNDIEKAWCYDFTNEGKEPVKESKKIDRNKNIEIAEYTAKSREYDDVEIALEKINEVNPMDRPHMLFNISKAFKMTKSENQLNELLEKSVKLDFVTKSQKNEIIRIIN